MQLLQLCALIQSRITVKALVLQLNQIVVILVIINACYPKPPLDVL